MELKQIEHFIRVAELGGFSKAATALALKQPVLSKHVRLLEVELHQNLLIRNGRGVSLTEEGTLFLAHAKGILAHIDRARQELRDIKGSPTGTVVVGCLPAVGVSAVTRSVFAFRKRFPKATLEIIELKGSSIIEWLLQGRIDFGILHDPSPSRHLDFIPVRKDRLSLISPKPTKGLKPSSVVTTHQLANYPLILPWKRFKRTMLEKAAAKADINLNVVLQLGGIKFVLDLVHQGYGHTILPKHLVQESKLADKLQVNAIVKPQLAQTLVIAVPSRHQITNLTRETLRLIQDQLAVSED